MKTKIFLERKMRFVYLFSKYLKLFCCNDLSLGKLILLLINLIYHSQVSG